jgi:hypothetical protein
MIHEFQNKYGKMALYRKKEKQGWFLFWKNIK